MKRDDRSLLLSSLILALLPLCLVSGGIQSPVRFLYYPGIGLLSLYLSRRVLLGTGIAFAVFFPLLCIPFPPGTVSLPALAAESAAFFLAALVAGYCAQRVRQERSRYENAIATFESLGNELSNKNMNLQTALDALSDAHRKLQEFDRNKTEFLSNVSHELRTPLSSIQSYSEILMNYDDIEPETQKEFLTIIHTESEKLSSYVTGMLDLVRIETGNTGFSPCPVQPGDVLRESFGIVRPMALEKGLSLELHDSEGIPDVRGDRNQLVQVLVNLLNNAVKFTHEGRISLGARLIGGFVEFFVSDTGEGVFPEETELIFKPFCRIAEHAPGRPKGSGLGLSISKGIVEFHGGKIWVDSQVGKGSTFFFTIPVAVPETMDTAPALSVPASGHIGLYKPILVVSSDTVSRRSLRKKLEDLGYLTLGADTPQRASHVLNSMRPGLIVSDVPVDWGGFSELVGCARAAGVRVLLASLFVQHGDEPHVAVHGYLTKPFDKYEIISLFEKCRVRAGTVLILSSDSVESRTLQVLLGAAGYESAVHADVLHAAQAAEKFRPTAIVLGTFRGSRLEDILSGFLEDPRIRRVPLFMLLGEPLDRYVTTVTLEGTNGTGGNEGLYKLVGEIEAEYAKRIG
ncbi:MAG: hypothetical protein GYA56_08510 [Geobacteraceae bacterium]|nr:hypothetical protein [Geobacteraceae bacterium]